MYEKWAVAKSDSPFLDFRCQRNFPMSVFRGIVYNYWLA